MAGWRDMFVEVIEEGTARALAGDSGEPQDGALATHAAPFTERERVLDIAEPVSVLRRKVAALNVLAPQARIELAGHTGTVREATAVSPRGQAATPGPPGTVLASHADGWTVQAGDGPVRLVVDPS
ncbi:hypothetical protein [Streptomyces sp. NBC_01198]|uniref:hypothetical protein n=1 Tax=Streptomyces sp. NBC_01198 TaxID=2903769 RepID=UPI002E13CF0E|nr:hypothetical protein OG702_33925 [Streptomyces sp. NBC_01198]